MCLLILMPIINYLLYSAILCNGSTVFVPLERFNPHSRCCLSLQWDHSVIIVFSEVYYFIVYAKSSGVSLATAGSWTVFNLRMRLLCTD